MTSMQRTQGHCPDDDEDEERAREFPAPTVRHVIPKLLGVLIGMTLAFLVLSQVGQTAGQSLFSQLFTGRRSGGPNQPGQTNERFTAQVPAVTEEPVVADRLTPRQRETSGPSEVTGTVSREASITSRKTSPRAQHPASRRSHSSQ
jgi:hypothetical protein